MDKNKNDIKDPQQTFPDPEISEEEAQKIIANAATVLNLTDFRNKKITRILGASEFENGERDLAYYQRLLNEHKKRNLQLLPTTNKK